MNREMKIGDLVEVIEEGLRTPVGGLGVVTRIEEREDSRGTIIQYWAHMTESGHQYWFRSGHLRVINANR